MCHPDVALVDEIHEVLSYGDVASDDSEGRCMEACNANV